jgi:hypothetical protein
VRSWGLFILPREYCNGNLCHFLWNLVFCILYWYWNFCVLLLVSPAKIAKEIYVIFSGILLSFDPVHVFKVLNSYNWN